MKIALPVDKDSVDTTVCVSFGRAPFFMIYDSEKRTYEFLDNSAVAASGGAGISAAQSLVDKGVSAVLTPRCGENGAAVLSAAGCKIYKTADGGASENIDSFLKDGLCLLGDIHRGFHNHGGKG